MLPNEVAIPAAVAILPRDTRGYPVLAITPWVGGEPQFAVTSTPRILICAVERRCSICGQGLSTGPVWRVVADDEAQAIARAASAEPGFANVATTVEPPGHLACMLYAAVVCPYLARPNARRGRAVEIGGFAAPRGAARGEVDGIGGAVVGFETYEFEVRTRVEFRFTGLVDFRPHRLGIEHLEELRDEVARESGLPPAGRSCPPYLLSDEAAAEARAARYR